jgi:hypothetical protein
MKNLGGWTRLGIVLTVLWTLVVLIELWIEFKQGPFGLGLLTDTVETGEPISSLGFRDSIPSRPSPQRWKIFISSADPRFIDVGVGFGVGVGSRWLQSGPKRT